MAQKNNSYETATGPIAYGFRNDYMFRAALQKSMKFMKGLVGSMLHLDPNDIRSVEITNFAGALTISTRDNLTKKQNPSYISVFWTLLLFLNFRNSTPPTGF